MQFMDLIWDSSEIEYALANVDADFNEMALDRAHQLVGDYSISKAYVEYALINEQYVGDEVAYAMANLDINWELEAAGAAWNYLDDYPDCTHDELRAHLINDEWFTADEADYACNYVGK